MEWTKLVEDLAIGVVAGLVSPVLLFIVLRPRLVISHRISIRGERQRIKIANYGYRHAAEVSLELTLHHRDADGEHVALLDGALSAARIAVFPRRRLVQNYPDGKSKRPNRLIFLNPINRTTFTAFGYRDLPARVQEHLERTSAELTIRQLLCMMDPTGIEGVRVRLTVTCSDGWTNFRRTRHRDFGMADVTGHGFKLDSVDVVTERTHLAGWFG